MLSSRFVFVLLGAAVAAAACNGTAVGQPLLAHPWAAAAPPQAARHPMPMATPRVERYETAMPALRIDRHGTAMWALESAGDGTGMIAPGAVSPRGAIAEPVVASDDEPSAPESLPDPTPEPSPGAQRGSSRFDPQLVAAGEVAFRAYCTQCHDANRALNRRKSFSGWMATVRRMAEQEGADIPGREFQPIATYLASVAGTQGPVTDGAADSGAQRAADEDEGSTVSLFATVSLIHRSGASNGVIENEGFFPEVWVGGAWRPDGPLSARVNACVTCHTESPGVSSRIELAEGYLRLDVMQWLTGCESDGLEVTVTGGRFIVPFGAFAGRSHPGAYQTATRPLMYNMGQNVYRDELGPPLLPMPYSDEGVLLSASAPVCGDVTATLDGYVVNGLAANTALHLQGFFPSRDYVDNNSEPALGGRLTLGTPRLRGGASVTSGRFNPNDLFGPGTPGLFYHIWGVDLSWRHGELARVYLEWARRESDVFNNVREEIEGVLVEGVFKLTEHPRIDAVFRYDNQHRLAGPPLNAPNSPASGRFDVDRYTWGFNFAIATSTLAINHERWIVPAPLRPVDVLAIRWVASY